MKHTHYSTSSKAFRFLLMMVFTLSINYFDVWGQLTLTGVSYTQNFDGIGSGLPPGWTVRTGATNTARGTAATLTTTTTTWANTAGNFRNVASANSLAFDATDAIQNSSTDRALGIRQTGTFGDPGASFEFEIDNTTGRENFNLSLKHQMLSVQTRSTTWTVQYSTNGGTSWTDLGTYTDPGVFGSTSASYSFGSSLNNLSSTVLIRIIALTASTSTGSRDTYGIDDFELTWTNSPTINLSETSISNLDYLEGQGPSANQTFTVSGANLTENIILTAPANFEISTDASSGFGTSLELTQTGGTVASTTIYVRLAEGLSINTYAGTLMATSTGATTKNIGLEGIVSPLTPIITLSKSNIDGLDYFEGFGPSTSQTFTAEGVNLTDNITLTAPDDFEISTNASSGFGASLELIQTGGTVDPITIYVRLAAGLGANIYSGTLTATSTDASTQNISLSGEVSTAPPILTAVDVPYTENFSGFNSSATLPNGWSIAGSVLSYQGNWGTGTAGGLRGNANVLGYQHTGSTGIFTKTLTLLNDIGAPINQLEVSYLGRVERITEDRHPEYTVTVDGIPVPELTYSTSSGTDQIITFTVTGLNIPNGSTFEINWFSDRGFNTLSGSSRQIGISDVRVVVPPILTGVVSTLPFTLADCNDTQTGTVNYTIVDVFNPGNVFNAELSDENGSFDQPLAIGSLTSSLSGAIDITLPENLQTGSEYRIRVTSSNPAFTGSHSAAFTITQNGEYCTKVGDYRSNGSNTWSTSANWQTYSYNPATKNREWITAIDRPNNAASNVQIRNGHTITLDASPMSISNLFIEEGGKLFRNNSTCTGIRYINLSGDIICDGEIGNGITPDALGFNIQAGNHTIKGSGTFNAWRIRLSDENNDGAIRGDANLTIDMNVTLSWPGTICGGSNAIYSNRDANSIFNVTINPDKVLKITEPLASFGMDGSNGSFGYLLTNRGGGYTVFGTIDCAGQYMLGSNNPVAQRTYMTIKNGGLVKVKYLDYGHRNESEGGLLTIEAGGTLDITGTNEDDYTFGDTDKGSIIYDIQDNSLVRYSGTGLQKQPILFEYSNLEINKTPSSILETESNNLVVKNNLTFIGGIIQTNNPYVVNITNSSATAITDGAMSGNDRYILGKLKRNTDGVSSYSFPIGYTGFGAQGFSIDVNGSGNNEILGFLELNASAPIQAVAYCDVEISTAEGQQIGEGNFGFDGILDQITFNLHSPLQWNVTNPNGGITNYDITVHANGINDIAPVTSANGTPIRYLMKNGEPGENVSTGSALPSFAQTGFIACPNQYTLTGMETFSLFTIDGANAAATLLPVELLFITARTFDNQSIIVEWATATEINNDGFEIQRSENGIDFTSIGWQQGFGNYSGKLDYSFIDREVSDNKTYYYRLKQMDFDGAFEYSKTVSAQIRNTANNIQVYPVPSNRMVYIKSSSEISSVEIYDTAGRKIKTAGNADAGNTEIEISELNAGVYFIRVHQNSGISTHKIIKN
jgi:hypothetical protein